MTYKLGLVGLDAFVPFPVRRIIAFNAFIIVQSHINDCCLRGVIYFFFSSKFLTSYALS